MPLHHTYVHWSWPQVFCLTKCALVFVIALRHFRVCHLDGVWDPGWIYFKNEQKSRLIKQTTFMGAGDFIDQVWHDRQQVLS